MKIVFGAILAVAGLVVLAVGAKRSRVALVIGTLLLALGGYNLYFGVKASRKEKEMIAFIAAAERGDVATVRRMADADPLFVNSIQRNEGAIVNRPLHAAALGLHADVVDFLLSRGAIVDAENNDGSTALHAAGDTVSYGDAAVPVKRAATIRALLAHGATVNAKDDRDRTPLMASAHDATAVALLIEHKADVKARDSSGRTALHYAVIASGEHADAVAALLDHGAEVDPRDRNGETPFLLAATNSAELETLVARGADTKTRDEKGQTALHRAAYMPRNLFSDLDALAVLCSCGLRPETRDHAGATPLSIARERLSSETSHGWMQGRQRIVNFLSPDGACGRLIGASKDQRAFAVAEIRCAEDDRGGCEALAWDYDSGRGTAIDKSRAAEVYDKTCRLGSQWACANLAYNYDHGEGVAEDLARAAALYGPACDAGEMRACYNVALLYANGRGVAKDHARAVALFRRACDAGDRDACEHAAR